MATTRDLSSGPEASRQYAAPPKTEGSESKIRIPFCDMFFGHFDEELNWAQKTIGSLIELAPIEEKQRFYSGGRTGWKMGNHSLCLGRGLGGPELTTAKPLATLWDGSAGEGLARRRGP